MRTTIAITIALALSLTGCIANLAGLKESQEDMAETLEQTSAVLNQTAANLNSTGTGTTQQTVAQKPPVARISIFGENGALIYKTNFQAEDSTEILRVDQDAKLNLIASDSEAVERGATLSGFAWSLSGKSVEGGRQATLVAETPGVHVLTLTVTDSNGKSDTQSVKLGVAPKPFAVETQLVTGPVAGAVGEGQAAELTFDVSLEPAGGPAKITSMTVTVTPPQTCDAILTVNDPEGGELGSKDTGGFGEGETVTTGELVEGAYGIIVAAYACAAPEGMPVLVTVVYTPIIEGLDGEGDGHAGH